MPGARLTKKAQTSQLGFALHPPGAFKRPPGSPANISISRPPLTRNPGTAPAPMLLFTQSGWFKFIVSVPLQSAVVYTCCCLHMLLFTQSGWFKFIVSYKTKSGWFKFIVSVPLHSAVVYTCCCLHMLLFTQSGWFKFIVSLPLHCAVVYTCCCLHMLLFTQSGWFKFIVSVPLRCAVVYTSVCLIATLGTITASQSAVSYARKDNHCLSSLPAPANVPPAPPLRPRVTYSGNNRNFQFDNWAELVTKEALLLVEESDLKALALPLGCTKLIIQEIR
ncbi:hypothetical protein DPMN_004489 [Dreissena polymorpha]|uniref:Uncharacterized protein n=1 Tax=Dreissena polymorpha TaxID=45954 RepID=A0A9D4MSR5_DREPO|nr:hypothetical protein DPMN_004489 [Dreissena polymorpha]